MDTHTHTHTQNNDPPKVLFILVCIYRQLYLPLRIRDSYFLEDGINFWQLSVSSNTVF